MNLPPKFIEPTLARINPSLATEEGANVTTLALAADVKRSSPPWTIVNGPLEIALVPAPDVVLSNPLATVTAALELVNVEPQAATVKALPPYLAKVAGAPFTADAVKA